MIVQVLFQVHTRCIKKLQLIIPSPMYNPTQVKEEK